MAAVDEQAVAVGALALILAAKVRVTDLEREFMQQREPLLEKYKAGTRIERHACTLLNKITQRHEFI